MIRKALHFRLDAGFFLLMIITGGIMMMTASTQPDIVSFELARTLSRVQEIFQSWGETGKALARRNILLDFIFIPAYAGFLFLFSFRVYQAILHPYLPLFLTRFIASLALLAAFLDVLENLCLLQLLAGKLQEWIAASAFWLASFKFLFAGITGIFGLAGILLFIFSPKKQKAPPS